jgi:hypothetical protein
LSILRHGTDAPAVPRAAAQPTSAKPPVLLPGGFVANVGGEQSPSGDEPKVAHEALEHLGSTGVVAAPQDG